jgi:hypothetical protein
MKEEEITNSTDFQKSVSVNVSNLLKHVAMNGFKKTTIIPTDQMILTAVGATKCFGGNNTGTVLIQNGQQLSGFRRSRFPQVLP